MRYQSSDYHQGERRRRDPERRRSRADGRQSAQPPDFGPWDADEEDDDMERSEAYRGTFESEYANRESRPGSQRQYGDRGGRNRMGANRRGRQRGDAGLGDNYSEPEIEQYGYDYGQPIFAGEYGEQSRDYGQRGDRDFSRGERGNGDFGRGQRGQGDFGRFEQRGRRFGRDESYGRRDFGRGGQYSEGPFGQGQRSDEQWGQRRPSSGERWSGTGSWERAGQGLHSGKGPKGYQRSDDRIREDLCDHLTDDPELDASNIEVKVQNCEVTLSGTVESRQLKRLAEDIAEGCPGVRDVRNEIRVAQQNGGGQQAFGQRGGDSGGRSIESEDSQTGRFR